MIVRDLPTRVLRERLAPGALRIRTGPIVCAIATNEARVAEGLQVLYGNHPVEPLEAFADYHVRLSRPAGLRRWIRPQVKFSMAAVTPFLPLPAAHAMAMLEWGMNWCVSNTYHCFLVLHAAALERHGRVVILPAPPGSGKSTLAAALANRGWRLMSDELTLIDPATLAVHALARPISLKNASIDLMKGFAPEAVFGSVVRDTTKGTVAHMAAPPASVARMNETALPGWVVMPRYERGAASTLTPLSRGRAMMHLVENAFNYAIQGRAGFDTLAGVVRGAHCYEYVYSNIDDAMRTFDRLAAEHS